MRSADVQVEFAEGPPLLRPEGDELSQAVRERVDELSPWLCARRGGPDSHLYIQAYFRGPDAWEVEHRFGSAGEHYAAVGHQNWETTERVLLAWIAAEPGWRELVDWQKLDFPARQVPVAHEPDFRTRWIGTHDGGQFFGDVTGAPGLDGLMALVHSFDAEGGHLGSEFRPAADGATGERELAGLLDGLSGVAYGDIRIRPFEVVSHGVSWGLIDGTAERDGSEHYELEPQGLGFGAPFDGLYDT
ncbi:hypothetical protein ABT095_25350 [Kitasatospora sp. NPDC002227]|uniref:hypothetical protein n=1 Tax=Kitasatospora sp. NPDC002227 TaxID=3154773 RepID=UPI00332FA463